MIIISWDVGVIHLAYCVLEYFPDSSVKILDWDEINLMEDEKISFTCCGKIKVNKGEDPKICGKNATYYLVAGYMGESYGFCKTHLSQHSQYWSKDNTTKLFSQITGKYCNHKKTDGSECGKNAKYLFTEHFTKIYYCTIHYKGALNKKIKEYSPQPIKNMIVKKYPTSQLQLILVKKLDNLVKHFARLGIEEVIIENQPSMKNPKMKAIAGTLFDYFMIRGYIDKIHNLDIQLVRFMCPSNKLKVNNKNTIEVFKATNKKVKYKLTKALSIQYTKKLLADDPLEMEYLDLYKKQDDICDAYLQGRYYLEFVKNKKNIPKKVSKQNTIKRFGSKKVKKKYQNLKRKKNKAIITL